MKKKLKISVELLTAICSAFALPKGERYFEVIEDPLPENHTIVGTIFDHLSQSIDIVIESPDFIDDGREYIIPTLQAVKQ